MRYLNSLIVLALVVTLTLSCSDDDSGSSDTNFNYINVKTGNSWDYDVETGNQTLQDNLTVSSQSGNSFELESDPVIAAGLMTGLLSSGTLTQQDGTLISDGTLGLNFQGVGDFSVDISNGVVYDQNASNGEQLFTTNGSFAQAAQGFDLDINYVASTVQQESLESLTVNGIQYDDVIHSQLLININITSDLTVAGFTTTVTLLQPQDVFTVDNYWARDIGLIRSDNQLNYTLEDFSSLGVSLPFPQSANVLTTQELTLFTEAP